MGNISDRPVSNWTLWLWLLVAIPVGVGVAWIARNFSPVAPDALSVPVACAVVFTMAVAVSSRGAQEH